MELERYTPDPYNRVDAHRASKPSWRCLGCGAPWPCAETQASLRRQYRDRGRTTLLIYLGTQYAHALRDLYRQDPVRAPHPQTLYDRFVGWAADRNFRHPT